MFPLKSTWGLVFVLFWKPDIDIQNAVKNTEVRGFLCWTPEKQSSEIKLDFENTNI